MIFIKKKVNMQRTESKYLLLEFRGVENQRQSIIMYRMSNTCMLYYIDRQLCAVNVACMYEWITSGLFIAIQ